MIKKIFLPETQQKQLVSMAIKLSVLSLLFFFSLMQKELIYIAFAVSILIVSFEKDFDGFYYIFFLVAFRHIFRNGIDGSIQLLAILTVYYMLFYLIKTVFVKKKKIKIDWWLVGTSFIFILYLLVPINDFVFKDFVTVAISLSIIFFVFQFKEEINAKKIIVFFCLGVLVATLIGLITQSQFSSSVFFKTEIYSSAYGYERFRGLLRDPNYLTFDITIAITGLVALWSKNQIKEYILYPAFFLFFVFGFITYSKSFILIAGVVLVLFLAAAVLKNKKNMWKELLYFLLALGLAIFVLEVCFKSNIFVIFKRFSGVDLHDSTESTNLEVDAVLTGRWSLWKNHLKYLFLSIENLLFGGGIGTYLQPMEAHNTYIQILYEIGLVGTLMLTAIIIFYCIKILKNKKYGWSIANLLPLICFVLLIGNYNYFNAIILPYYIVFVAFAVGYKNIRNQNGTKKVN